MIIIVAGAIGRAGIGGHAWMYMQFLDGLQSLGHDVYYLEDCGEESWIYDWRTETMDHGLDYPARFVNECLDPLNLGKKWIYRAGSESRGIDQNDFADICAQADLLIVHCNPFALWRKEYDLPKKRAYLDGDPGFIQLMLLKGNHPTLAETVERCEALFTVGQRIGKPDCSIPTAGKHWHKTVHPVALKHWPFVAETPAPYFTSLMKWEGFYEISYKGLTFGQKDREFPKFIDLPSLTAQPIYIAQMGADANMLLEHGWKLILPGWLPSLSPWSYRGFIQNSRAEFGVAKHGYVVSKGGWFSERSMCYMASGRPVLIEDTGLTDWLPTGKGLVVFRTVDEAVNGVESINADYEAHRRAARSLVEEYFAAERVLPDFLQNAMN